MPQYTYQRSRGEPIKTSDFDGTAQEFAELLAFVTRLVVGDHVTADVRVWHGTGPVTDPPAATAH